MSRLNSKYQKKYYQTIYDDPPYTKYFLLSIFSPFELIAKETVLFSYSFPFIYIIRNRKIKNKIFLNDYDLEFI